MRYLLIILAVVAAYLIYNYIKPQEWTLMVCDGKLNASECYDNSYEIPGFKSAKECLLEGADKFAKEGFECGRDCKTSDLGLNICSEICNKSGCGK